MKPCLPPLHTHKHKNEESIQVLWDMIK
jgi:hypothetical protein